MIITRTPFRLSFLGGGTDLPAFYQVEEGFVVSTTIDKFIYITINSRFDNSYRLSYRQNENCQNITDIQHPIIRTVLAKHWSNKQNGLEIVSMADIPAGSGLGSSSSFTVGLLNAVQNFNGLNPRPEDLAEEACRIEIEDLSEPIGKQDQYAAALGGLRSYRFLPDGRVIIEPIQCAPQSIKKLEASVMMFFTGLTRSASAVLSEQQKNTLNKLDELRSMKQGALKFKKIIEEGGRIQSLGEILHEGWHLKRTMAGGITNPQIDEWYERGVRAGAYGGKLLGAGGGGFLMFLCEPDLQQNVEKELNELKRLHVSFEAEGSRVVLQDRKT